MNRWINENYYENSKEIQYKNINPKIICEKYIESSKDNPMVDCKVFCFGGSPEVVVVIDDTWGNRNKTYYNTKGEKIDIKFNGNGNSDIVSKKPQCLDKIIQLSRKLSQEFQFVRVDFCVVDNKIYFSELTFTPEGGIGDFEPIEESIRFANMINI